MTMRNFALPDPFGVLKVSSGVVSRYITDFKFPYASSCKANDFLFATYTGVDTGISSF